jgi:hypothetical protein
VKNRRQKTNYEKHSCSTHGDNSLPLCLRVFSPQERRTTCAMILNTAIMIMGDLGLLWSTPIQRRDLEQSKSESDSLTPYGIWTQHTLIRVVHCYGFTASVYCAKLYDGR